jgi:hypothetical protein
MTRRLLLVLLLHAALAQAGGITVTRTWADLLRQPAHKLKGGETVWLGIETTTPPRARGMLLYCLTEGYTPPTTWQGRDRIGPLRVTIERDGVREAAVKTDSVMARRKVVMKAKALFVRAVRLGRESRLRVHLLGPDDGELGKVEVRPSDAPYHPWTPWARDDRRRDLERARPGEEGIVVGYVANRSDGIAIPRWDPMQPIVFEGNVGATIIQRHSGERLPTIVPAAEDPGLKLAWREGTLRVTSDVDINLSRPDWHFLTRWWVNDRPFIPKQMGSLLDQNGRVIMGKTLDLRVAFDPAKIGAKPGDRIGLQLFHCPQGWTFATGLMEQLADLSRDTPLPRLTNRIDFVAPGRSVSF